MSSIHEALDASPGQLAALDQAAARLVDLLALQARVGAAVTIQLAQCAQVAREIGDRDNHPKNQDFVDAMVASEIGARARINDRAMQTMIGEAQCLVIEYPRTIAALHDARISQAHVRVIQRAGLSIMDQSLRAGYETAVLEHAVKETTNRLRPIAKRLAERFTTATFEERHEREKVRRFVEVTTLGDGMAQLIALLPATEAFAIEDRLSQLAHATSDPHRSIPELRADILTDLLLCAAPTPGVHGEPQEKCGPQSGGGLGNIQARVMVTIPVLALLPADRIQEIADLSRAFESCDGISASDGHSASGNRSANTTVFSEIAGLDGSAQLAGHSPINIETAKVLAGNAKAWTRVMVHPITGAVLSVDRYRPSQEQRRTLAARDMHCRFPGCRIPIQKCDLDHTIAAEHGGPTEISNLAHLCRRHHTLKHHGQWSVEQLENGTLRWNSPTGYSQVEDPPSTAMFKPTGTTRNRFSEIPPF